MRYPILVFGGIRYRSLHADRDNRRVRTGFYFIVDTIGLWYDVVDEGPEI